MSEAEEFTAAAPPDPEAPSAGETSFTDAEAPPAAEPRADAAAEDEAQKYLALAQRTQADFENFRKRMARENKLALDKGVAKLAKELLPALDHFDLALKAARDTQPASEEGTGDDLAKGFEMVRDELIAALGRVGIQPYSPHGEPFDPNEHEAMVSQPATDGVEPGSVLEVYQQGYRINGAVLRPARVVVAQ
jgi:molecular chaperone GrpE